MSVTHQAKFAQASLQSAGVFVLEGSARTRANSQPGASRHTGYMEIPTSEVKFKTAVFARPFPGVHLEGVRKPLSILETDQRAPLTQGPRNA